MESTGICEQNHSPATTKYYWNTWIKLPTKLFQLSQYGIWLTIESNGKLNIFN